MPQLVVNQPPPKDYYANNLRTLVGHVVDEYGTLLSSSELKITRRFFQLSRDAGRLIARLAMRKGPLYRLDSLHYGEVNNLTEAVEELEKTEFVDFCNHISVFDLLSLLSIRELLTTFTEIKTGRKKK